MMTTMSIFSITLYIGSLGATPDIPKMEYVVCSSVCDKLHQLHELVDLFPSNLAFANTNQQRFLEGNEVYTEVKKQQEDDGGQLYKKQENENPLYEPATSADAAAFNSIYDRFVVVVLFFFLFLFFFNISCIIV